MLLLERHVAVERKNLFEEAAKLWKKLEEASFWGEIYRVFEELPKKSALLSGKEADFPEEDLGDGEEV
jgi:hypothetical protein